MIEIKSLSGAVLWSGEAESLADADLRGANLRDANLSDADLRGANLAGANLWGAKLWGANLRDANLRCANLSDADLRGANLRSATLRGANLWSASLRDANLRGANLRDANLRDADLRDADLLDANLPAFQISAGDLVGWKRSGECLVELRIPREARRTGSLVGRKCRAEWAEVVAITDADGQPAQQVASSYDPGLIYRVGEIVRPDGYNDDPRVECTSGIHFFQIREEAASY